MQQAHMPVGGVQLVPAHREQRSTAQPFQRASSAACTQWVCPCRARTSCRACRTVRSCLGTHFLAAAGGLPSSSRLAGRGGLGTALRRPASRLAFARLNARTPPYAGLQEGWQLLLFRLPALACWRVRVERSPANPVHTAGQAGGGVYAYIACACRSVLSSPVSTPCRRGVSPQALPGDTPPLDIRRAVGSARVDPAGARPVAWYQTGAPRLRLLSSRHLRRYPVQSEGNLYRCTSGSTERADRCCANIAAAL